MTRATAVSKAASLGVVLVLLGTLAMAPSPRNAVLVVLVLVAHIVTLPLSGMALGRAAYRSGTAQPPVTTVDEPRSRRERASGAGPGPRPLSTWTALTNLRGASPRVVRARS